MTVPELAEIYFWIFTVLCAGFGAYLGSYLKKKGENLATKEDIEELTRRTKEIEAKIDDQVWNRQRHWEMKRDALYSAVGALGRADDALLSVASTYETAQKGKPEDWEEIKLEGIMKYDNESTNFDQKRFEASLICGGALDYAMGTASKEIRGAATKVFKGEAIGYASVSKPIQAAINEVMKLARKELGIDLN